MTAIKFIASVSVGVLLAGVVISASYITGPAIGKMDTVLDYLPTDKTDPGTLKDLAVGDYAYVSLGLWCQLYKLPDNVPVKLPCFYGGQPARRKGSSSDIKIDRLSETRYKATIPEGIDDLERMSDHHFGSPTVHVIVAQDVVIK
jgi:hypothetical protein